jgi:hypothetical protein
VTITPNHYQPRDAAGQFAEKAHAEAPALVLPAVPSTAFDEGFDRDFGAGLVRELEQLAPVEVHQRLNASRCSDLLREAYADYFPDGNPEHSIAESHARFRAMLPNLDDDRAAHHLELVGFAISNEIKHLANREFVIGNDYPWEVRADRADYDSEDEYIEQGNTDSGEAWAELADTAMVHALQENDAAGR